MIISLQIRTAIMLLVVIISMGLVFFIYNYGKDKLLNNLFIFLIIFLLGWLLPVYITLHPSFPYLAIIGPRVSLAVTIGMLDTSFLLSYKLVHNKMPQKWKLSLMCLLSLFLIILIFTTQVFVTSVINNNIISAVTSWGMYFFSLYSVVLTLLTIIILIRGISLSNNSTEKKQLRLVLYGYFGMNAGFIFTIMLPIIIFQNAIMVQFGGLYILFFLICTAIAIVKYHLFNIRIIATEFLVLIFNSILFIQLAASNSIKRGVLNGLLLILSGALSYLLVKHAQRELKQEREITRADALEESNRRLVNLDKQKTEFLTIAAHQLRTPTSIVNNYLSMIKDGDYGKVGKDLLPVLDNIESSNQWLIKLADKLLYLSKIEQGDIKYHFEQCDIVSLIKKTIAEFIPLADEKGLKIVFSDNGGGALNVNIDEEKIKLAVFNLLDNAVRYSEKGEIMVMIAFMQADPTLSFRPERSEVEESRQSLAHGVSIRVIDQGIGFAPEDKEKFFHKFQRGANASGTNVHTSTGLGLYLVRKFVEGHGGYVWARSEGEGKGSEFGFWIPANQPKK